MLHWAMFQESIIYAWRFERARSVGPRASCRRVRRGQVLDCSYLQCVIIGEFQRRKEKDSTKGFYVFESVVCVELFIEICSSNHLCQPFLVGWGWVQFLVFKWRHITTKSYSRYHFFDPKDCHPYTWSKPCFPCLTKKPLLFYFPRLNPVLFHWDGNTFILVLGIYVERLRTLGLQDVKPCFTSLQSACHQNNQGSVLLCSNRTWSAFSISYFANLE